MSTLSTMYTGIRGPEFVRLIRSILEKGIAEEYLKFLLSDDSIKKFSMAFTSKNYDRINNYEMFEQLGDVSINKFIVNYMYKRFPQLNGPAGVDVVARLKIKYSSKNQLMLIAESLGMWDFISSTLDERENNKRGLLEDTFEAFFGLVELLIDQMVMVEGINLVGVGFNIIFIILTKIFDELTISIKYEDLVDPKTRLNELAIEKRTIISDLKYIDTCKSGVHKSTVQANLFGKGNVILGVGTGSTKKDSQEMASDKALMYLQKKHNIVKETPQRYRFFSDAQI